MEKGKYVSRSAYQKLAEQNKKLILDLKSICFDMTAESIIDRHKWYKYFDKQEAFNKAMKSFAIQYIKEHPEYDITKIKL